MKVLITGAAGFLGRAFVRHHLAAGDDVLGIDDLSSSGSYWPEELAPEFQLTGDVRDFFEQWHEGFDLGYHFAAPVGGRMKIEGDPLFNAASLGIDAAFFRWAVGKLGAALYPSSSAVYGTSLQEGHGRALQEGMFHPANPNWFAPDEMYGFTKLAGEVLAYKASAYGLDTLCIRPFSGYGEGQSFDYPIPSILRRAKRHEDPLIVWGSGDQKRDFIHVDDIVATTTSRLSAGLGGYESLNIGSGFPVSFKAIAEVAAEIAGYSPEIVTDPGKPQGVDARYCDIGRMHFYHDPQVSLGEGLRRVMESIDA